MSDFLPFASDEEHKMTTTSMKQPDETILPTLHRNPNRVLEIKSQGPSQRMIIPGDWQTFLLKASKSKSCFSFFFLSLKKTCCKSTKETLRCTCRERWSSRSPWRVSRGSSPAQLASHTPGPARRRRMCRCILGAGALQPKKIKITKNNKKRGS